MTDKKKFIKQIALAAVLSIFFGNIFLWVGAKTIFVPIERYLWNAGYSLSIGLSLFSNGLFFDFIERKYISWMKHPVRSFVIAIAFHLAYSTFVIFFFNWLWFTVFMDNTWSEFLKFGWFIILEEYFILVVVTAIIYAKSFFKEWREEAIQAERLRAESIALQYQVMQNQVNPHFLFNSLNVLNNLIDIDPEKAKDYTIQLSDFYRNLLSLRNHEIISIGQEVDFVKRYVHLQKIRFGDNFNVTFLLPEIPEGEVIPMSLQMLFENAVKHNEISRENPLEIKVSNDHRGYIVVENNLHLKKDVQHSSKIGLKNLNDRYRYLTGHEIEISKTESYFRVSLPLIKLEP